uniref:Neurotransmitter-gated ion-channel ligand-binding domain-containing protein n=1 Tax=Pyramimonas obovata TaxID=1411642 RepID=A0A7S0RIT9_9CHLO|mmetsp:Transcript_35257/g.77058  ORF Transcript_35257/g.77058 Transcript_35257/m.77058 type:complete len:478 (+) Transcript_35257:367-1800(+)|eukprot:CAMPEP_0118938962 /NCGR_PEP_ID=MMETSP1169-20130426/27558_1 /TAXON_ID=36882 /ORGANISM="Pyramimonas obovata, Strain CCMP722" /LENGTH=477 /DNA_ID=CAMNT_0006883099 /DNA_START=302 /DNA_END=1738 /DNA_ORIENTATION=-
MALIRRGPCWESVLSLLFFLTVSESQVWEPVETYNSTGCFVPARTPGSVDLYISGVLEETEPGDDLWRPNGHVGVPTANNCQFGRANGRGYSAITRPKDATNSCYNRSAEPEEVEVTLFVAKLWSIDEKHTDFRLSGSIETSHVDCRFAMNTSTLSPSTQLPVIFSRAQLVHIGLPDPWTPYLYFAQLIESFSKNNFGPNEELYSVEADGHVHHRSPFNVKLDCALDFKHLPYDQHVCTIVLYNNIFTVQQMLLNPKIAVKSDLSISAWDIDEDAWTATTDDLEGNGVVTRRAVFSFTITRKAHLWEMTVMLPAALYWVLSYSGFYISATPARAALHTMPILMMVNQLVSVSAQLPPIGYTIWIQDYVYTLMILVILQLCSSVTVDWCRSIKGGNAFAKVVSLNMSFRNNLCRDRDGADVEAQVGLGVKGTIVDRVSKLYLRAISVAAEYGDSFNRIAYLLIFAVVLGVAFSARHDP